LQSTSQYIRQSDTIIIIIINRQIGLGHIQNLPCNYRRAAGYINIVEQACSRGERNPTYHDYQRQCIGIDESFDGRYGYARMDPKIPTIRLGVCYYGRVHGWVSAASPLLSSVDVTVRTSAVDSSFCFDLARRW